MFSRLRISKTVTRGASLLTLLPLYTGAVEFQTVHSSAQLYMENKLFTGSKQKTDGKIVGIGADIHSGPSEYRFAFEKGFTDTLQPPLDEDLRTDKLFLRYAYRFNDTFTANVNYITILNDNIAITDGGAAYGAGLTCRFNKQTSANFTQYYTDYDDFNVYQSDFRLDFKTKINKVKIKLSSVTKYISIDEENKNPFTKNAQNDYLTTAIELHSHYESYHFGAVAYFGNRVFAIMNDGFKIQHHPMEFHRTYATGIGKTIGDYVVRLQYIYQEATELPFNNENVRIENVRLIVNYKF